MAYFNGWQWRSDVVTDDERECRRRSDGVRRAVNRKRTRRRRAAAAALAMRLSRLAAEAPPLKMSGTRPARNQ